MPGDQLDGEGQYGGSGREQRSADYEFADEEIVSGGASTSLSQLHGDAMTAFAGPRTRFPGASFNVSMGSVTQFAGEFNNIAETDPDLQMVVARVSERPARMRLPRAREPRTLGEASGLVPMPRATSRVSTRYRSRSRSPSRAASRRSASPVESRRGRGGGRGRGHWGARPSRSTVQCSNCSLGGHTVAQCVKVDVASGFVRGCGKCNTVDHMTEDCDNMRPGDRFAILVVGRAGKPPLAARRVNWVALASDPERSEQTLYPMTVEEAKQWATEKRTAWNGYNYKENPPLLRKQHIDCRMKLRDLLPQVMPGSSSSGRGAGRVPDHQVGPAIGQMGGHTLRQRVEQPLNRGLGNQQQQEHAATVAPLDTEMADHAGNQGGEDQDMDVASQHSVNAYLPNVDEEENYDEGERLQGGIQHHL